MSQMVTWEQYSSLYKNLTEEQFIQAELQAQKEVSYVIGPIRWANITADTFGYEQLKECICHVIHKMAEDEEAGKGKGLSSVSNDGYSENYAIRTQQELKEELKSSIRRWLSGTGLVGAY